MPITGGARERNLTAEDAWIQRITLTMPDACPDGEPPMDRRDALNEIIRVGGLLPGGTVVIAPGIHARRGPPLGWALSEMSQARFTTAMGRGLRGKLVGDEQSASPTPAPATTASPSSRTSSNPIRASRCRGQVSRGRNRRVTHRRDRRRTALDPGAAADDPGLRARGVRVTRHAIGVRVNLTVS